MKIVYFSRSGTSKKIAEKIAQQLGAPLVELSDHKNWKGLIGYIRAGYYSMMNKDLVIHTSEPIAFDEEIVLVAPLWAGGVAQPARVFLRDKDLKKVSLLITSLGSKAKLDRPREVYGFVGDLVAKEKNEDVVIKSLLAKLSH